MTKDTGRLGTILTVPNGTLLSLKYFDSDIERCLEVRKKLEENPGIREYCMNHPEDIEVAQFLDLVGSFILGEEPVELEINEYPNILNLNEN
jgi:hypothetical protein